MENGPAIASLAGGPPLHAAWSLIACDIPDGDAIDLVCLDGSPRPFGWMHVVLFSWEAFVVSWLMPCSADMLCIAEHCPAHRRRLVLCQGPHARLLPHLTTGRLDNICGSAAAGMLVGGSLYAALRKVLFQLTGPGLHSQVRPCNFAGQLQCFDAAAVATTAPGIAFKVLSTCLH